MTKRPLDIVILGLSLSSSWGNGHATTFRALMRGLHGLGHRLTFLERDVSWYAAHRDLPDPDFCDLVFYESAQDLGTVHGNRIRAADVVVVGSLVPEGVAVIDTVAALSTGLFCFYDIDTPVTLSKLASADEAYIAPRQVSLFDIYLSFTGGPTLKRLRTEFHARRAEPLYCSVDETRYAPTGEAPRWDLGYLGTYSPDRQPALRRMLLDVAERMPARRFVVAGPQYPAFIHWPENVERIDHLPPSEHASFYGRQRFTLNLTRADMVAAGWSPSVRLFEAAACGCPAISDPWPGLEDFFVPGGAIDVARTTEEVCAILEETAEPRRLEVADRARRMVLSAHTGTARASDLLRCLSRVADADGTDIRAA
jgi:spore maturation protein CgeB